MLYIGKQGAIRYPGPGNIEMGDGSAGTVAMWYHPQGPDQWCGVFRADVDAANNLILGREQSLWRWSSRSNGNVMAIYSGSDTVAWRFVVATWDFTGGPGAGVLRLYLDGQEVAESPLATASAPVGIPASLTIGPGQDNTRNVARAAYDQFAIWNEAMTAEQVADLYAMGREHRPEEADGSGALLLRAGWDEQFDADVAEGSATATLEGATDEYCRLWTRSIHDGKRFKFDIGMPTHDGTDEDRVPLTAVLVPAGRGSVTVTNTEEYGQVEVDACGEAHPSGVALAPWLPEPLKPMTLRVGLHLRDYTGPINAPVAVGALDYFSGNLRATQAGAGCTTDTVVSSAFTQPDGYWEGAELHILSGNLLGQKVRVTGNSAAGTSVTIDGALSEPPAEGDHIVLVAPDRVELPGPHGNEYRLECDIAEEHEGAERFAILEVSVIGAEGYCRYNMGRIQYYPSQVERTGVFFGKRPDGTLYDEWQCSLLIDRVEIDGPGAYERTSRTDDTFLVTDPATGESIKAARTENVERETRLPEQYETPTDIQQAMKAPGTWREDLVTCPRWMTYDVKNDRLVAVLVGKDADGVARAGYIHGTWNEAEGMIDWEDDPDPRNPFLLLSDLQAVLGGRSSIYRVLAATCGTFEVDEGNWALQFTATIGNPDGVVTCAMTGAPDRYSFDPQKHFDHEANPLTLAMAGDDKVVPEGSGIGLFGNRDCEIMFVENPWAKSRGDRFWGYGRCKTINQHGLDTFFQPARPLSCAVTGDFKNLRHVPWRNQTIAPAYGWFHWPHCEWFRPSTVVLVVDDGGATQSHVGLWAAEDGVHFQRVMSAIPRGTEPFNSLWMMPLCNPPRLGDRRVYWYRAAKSGTDFNMATIRLDGEALYRLTDGATAGELETCSLLRDGDYWEGLTVNVDPKGGTVTVAALDADTGSVIPGFDHADCDPIGDAVDTRVTWNGLGLLEVADESIRLEFRMTRSGEASPSPELYGWMIAPSLKGDEPEVTAVKVEGRVNPAAIANAHPELQWDYRDHDERPQSAYHVLVASTQEKLDANEGDLWDSGVVLSDKPVAKYAGEKLGSSTTYFWKVRVRNSEGVWSEEW